MLYSSRWVTRFPNLVMVGWDANGMSFGFLPTHIFSMQSCRRASQSSASSKPAAICMTRWQTNCGMVLTNVNSLRHRGINEANFSMRRLSFAALETRDKPPRLDNSGAVKLIFTGFSVLKTSEKSEFAWLVELFLLFLHVRTFVLT